MINKEEWIEKIRKLLALAESSNENEAQAAMLMAQKLMAKHHLELSEIQDAPVDHDVLEQEGDKKAHGSAWKRRLASLIAHNFQCETYLYGYKTYKTIFVGKKDNLEICKFVYSSAVRFIDINFTKYWNEDGKWNWCGCERPLSAAISEKTSYANGFIARLREKFKEQKVQADKEGWGLVLVKDADVTAYKATLNLKSASFVGGRTTSSNAYSQGYSDCNSKFGETGQKRIK